ncbi:hypothetical protein AM501_25770 [Aneurinibacillus migulanus]|uniref:hypothetical protein n=1 Tax=Aneurinibacillus migulanus TaxID=47500 RepID=UPI0006B58B19|nr:hypothetical protein [Aneurinibacillus migulanus]KPD05558.1 hypothetical protein AM501_25770 [Aneurinibacillus migulanus]
MGKLTVFTIQITEQTSVLVVAEDSQRALKLPLYNGRIKGCEISKVKVEQYPSDRLLFKNGIVFEISEYIERYHYPHFISEAY